MVLGLAILATLPVAAQSNELIDRVLASPSITYGDAAYLVLLGSGRIDETTPIADAVREAESAPVALGKAAEDPLTLGDFSLLTMESFGIPGGMMYRLLPLPRYAARELAFRDVVQGRTYPRMALSGERALRIVGRVLTLQEQGRLR